MSASMEERLKRRKLDALKRGVHRATGGEATPIATHLVGLGKAGAAVVAETLRNLQPGGPRLNALVVDIGEDDLAEVRALASSMRPDRAAVTVVSLKTPDRFELLAALETYPEFLSLEYPRYRNNSNYQPWLDPSVPLTNGEGKFSRAVAKAIYGQAYYEAPRLLHEALTAFASAVDAVPSHAMVAVIFGMGGATGSGIVVDLVRHLSNRCFGRRVLMAGIGIAPCDGDTPDHRGPGLYPLLNELDTMGDEEKNAGVVMSCGELFRNPFTAGFIIVPQQHAWLSTQDLALTHCRGNQEIASLLTAAGGTHLWELLRLLNWVAAPSTQHSAARTPWGARWIHMFGYADAGEGGVAVGQDLLQRLGLLPGYNPEFVELRVASLADSGVANVTASLQQALRPDVPPTVVEGGPVDSVQFVLPCISKASLQALSGWRDAYESQAPYRKILDHSLLLEQGILLSAPSTRIAGMAGASLWGGDAWVAVPMAGLLEEARPSVAAPSGVAR